MVGRGGPVDRAPDDEALLSLRLNRLGLSLAGTPLADDVATVHAELEAVGLVKPHVWLSTSFFSPDGVPGIGLPFWLAHPRLERLEKRLHHRTEGARRTERLALLRHEAGHAIDTAYRLFRRRDWRATFGLRSAPYPRTYGCDPRSRDFVRHLPRWYAQGHPAEDFAETFAVWLGTRGWRRRYAGWPALAKLEAVDRMLAEVAGTRPAVRLRERTDALPDLRETLRSLHRRRQRQARSEPPLPLDRLFGPVFPTDGAGRATAWLRAKRATLTSRLRRLGHDDYGLRQVLDLLAWRAERLEAALPGKPRALERTARELDATLRSLARGRARLAR